MPTPDQVAKLKDAIERQSRAQQAAKETRLVREAGGQEPEPVPER